MEDGQAEQDRFHRIRGVQTGLSDRSLGGGLLFVKPVLAQKKVYFQENKAQIRSISVVMPRSGITPILSFAPSQFGVRGRVPSQSC